MDLCWTLGSPDAGPTVRMERGHHFLPPHRELRNAESSIKAGGLLGSTTDVQRRDPCLTCLLVDLLVGVGVQGNLVGEVGCLSHCAQWQLLSLWRPLA